MDFNAILYEYEGNPVVTYHVWLMLDSLMDSGELAAHLYPKYTASAVRAIENEPHAATGNTVLSVVLKMVCAMEFAFESAAEATALFTAVYGKVGCWDAGLAWGILERVSGASTREDVVGLGVEGHLLTCELVVLAPVINTTTALQPQLDDSTVRGTVARVLGPSCGAAAAPAALQAVVELVARYNAAHTLEDMALVECLFATDRAGGHFEQSETWSLVATMASCSPEYYARVWALGALDEAQRVLEGPRGDLQLVYGVLVAVHLYSGVYRREVAAHGAFTCIVNDLLERFVDSAPELDQLVWMIVRNVVCGGDDDGPVVGREMAKAISEGVPSHVDRSDVAEPVFETATALVRQYRFDLQGEMQCVLPAIHASLPGLMAGGGEGMGRALTGLLDELVEGTAYQAQFVEYFVEARVVEASVVVFVGRGVECGVPVPGQAVATYASGVLDGLYGRARAAGGLGCGRRGQGEAEAELAAMTMLVGSAATLETIAGYVNECVGLGSETAVVMVAWTGLAGAWEAPCGQGALAECVVVELLRSAGTTLERLAAEGEATGGAQTVWRAIALVVGAYPDLAGGYEGRVACAFGKGDMDSSTALSLVDTYMVCSRGGSGGVWVVEVLIGVLRELVDCGSEGDMLEDALSKLSRQLGDGGCGERMLTVTSAAMLGGVLCEVLDMGSERLGGCASTAVIRTVAWTVVGQMEWHHAGSNAMLGEYGICELLESNLAEAMETGALGLKDSLFKAAWRLGSESQNRERLDCVLARF